jgi:hypothetical protein
LFHEKRFGSIFKLLRLGRKNENDDWEKTDRRILYNSGFDDCFKLGVFLYHFQNE